MVWVVLGVVLEQGKIGKFHVKQGNQGNTRFSDLFLFPNRSLLLRVLILVQRKKYTETHTKREAVRAVGRPPIAFAVLKFAEDLAKS